MKLNVLTLVLAVTAFSAVAATAEETTVIKEREAPGVGVVVKEPTPSVTVRERETTGSRDCSTRSVTRTDADHDASKTVTTKRCD
jgi:hypothetical protein